VRRPVVEQLGAQRVAPPAGVEELLADALGHLLGRLVGAQVLARAIEDHPHVRRWQALACERLGAVEQRVEQVAGVVEAVSGDQHVLAHPSYRAAWPRRSRSLHMV
jgi:hypothetical protein